MFETSGSTVQNTDEKDNLSQEEKDQARKKYQELLNDYTTLRSKAKNPYDYYNIFEKSVLEMEVDDDKQGASGLLEDMLAA